ncbi:uncharacterized protein BDR25DRAFT_108826 [Lindgomyces ingoldianus]|uniref:Uncharacterized protein n=1 Tax=Lindgomyces ingoldianus TaxID=673940 RepID=A0ACB6QBH8_9PLEO|nr:uncharacterized protein BDR25DRAFT_108826 [Lindgomyces ingoldianus]KAF2463477.1 hypothetical protein BDR25DRAFT_108826 [Lindgomyces ingoldianus]
MYRFHPVSDQHLRGLPITVSLIVAFACTTIILCTAFMIPQHGVGRHENAPFRNRCIAPTIMHAPSRAYIPSYCIIEKFTLVKK